MYSLAFGRRWRSWQGTCPGIAEQIWTRGTPMPTPRSERVAAALCGQVYAAGGVAQFGTTAAFETCDSAAGCWEELPALPEAMHRLGPGASPLAIRRSKNS
jgi:hypothetical protein